MMDCCTYWFEGWWAKMCCKHDEDYQKSELSRLESDNALFKSVFHSLDRKSKILRIFSLPVATMMWVGVRIGGQSRYIEKQNSTGEER